MCQTFILCIIKVELQVARPFRTWNQIVEAMVQGPMHTKCIYTSPSHGGNSSIQGDSKAREREMRVEVLNVLPEIFCIIIYLTCE